MKSFSLFISLLSLVFQLAAQDRIYVNQAAIGANDGSSWANARTDLRAALLTAQAGDEVWVAEGAYYPTATADRGISFEPASGVRLYGGFAGTETQLAQRDWQAHPSVLSGDIGVTGDSSDNSYNVVYLFEPDSNTVLDGFTVQHGNANVATVSVFNRQRSGGGLYIMGQDADAYPDIRNCIFTHNTARTFGGAVMVYGGGDGSVAPHFVNCRFEDNRAVGSGGAVARIGGSWVERGNDLEGCTFLRNRAGYRGGGFYYLDSERADRLDIQGCIFEENVAVDDGGGAYLSIGRSVPSGYSITRSVFRGNQANDGAAFVSFPGGWLLGSYINIDSCEFTDNRFSPNGPPQYEAVAKMELLGESDARGQVKNCIFHGNNNWPYVVAMFLDNAEIIFENIVIKNNQFAGTLCSPGITNSNTNIYNSIFTENSFSSEICTNNGDKVSYQNCIFEKNTSSEGQYMDDGNLDTLLYQNCTFSNNNIGQPYLGGAVLESIILCKNTTISDLKYGYQFFRTDRHAYISNCHFDSSFTCPGPSSYIVCLNDNIFGSDPLFVNPDSGDYHLQPCSPLLNAGSNAAAAGLTTDLAGNPRILGGTVDIGAYEAPEFGFSAAPTVKPACLGQAGGSITVAPANGCEPLNYLWQPGGPAGPTLGGLLPGAYQVTVTDAKGRTAVDIIAVPAADPPMLQADGSPVSCFGAADAALSVSPLSGLPPFAYLWQPGGFTDSLLTGLGPGPVAVTVTDAAGCTATFAFTVPQPDSLQFTATVQHASSATSADGSILVNTVTGGTAPYTYLWQPGGSTEDMVSGLLPGPYTLTITDTRGCAAVWAFEVEFTIETTEAGEQAVLLIYPNPAGEAATVAGDFPEKLSPARLGLYDAAGRLLRSLTLPGNGAATWQVPLENLAAGQYLVLLYDTAGKTVGAAKLVKQ